MSNFIEGGYLIGNAQPLGGPQLTIVPMNQKIADITHADTNKHMLDLATALSETREIIFIQTFLVRTTGTGYMRMYPNEGASYITGSPNQDQIIIIKDGTNELQYNLTVVNDDWDVYCLGYGVLD